MSVKFSPHVRRQLVILSICRFAEPVAMTSVFPYLYYMIKSFGVPDPQIAFYVGIIGGSFPFCQFFTSLIWGRASDQFGRKPTILLGLIGTLVSLLMFGFATSLPMAIAARCLAGFVNGNVGILRTMVAEMVPEKELQPRAFSIMPLIWSTGSILGPAIGGSLADPLLNHPEWFGLRRPAFFVKFPFALPNLVCALLFVVGLGVGALFLEETLETKRNKPDSGRLLGQKLVSFFQKIFNRKQQQQQQQQSKHIRTPSSTSSSSETSPLLCPASTDEETAAAPSRPPTPIPEKAPPIREAFTFQSSCNILVYGLLALHSVSFDQLLPVLMSSPVQDPDSGWKLPFKFAGGLGMLSSEIGGYFTMYGAVGMFLQYFLFPPLTNLLGPLRCYKLTALAFPLIYFLTPFILILPTPSLRAKTMLAIMGVKSVMVIFAFPCSTILLTNSAPSLRVLGTLNGIAVMAAAGGRAIGPAIGGISYTYGQQTGYAIIPWFLLAFMAVIGAIPVWWLVEGEGFATTATTATAGAGAGVVGTVVGTGQRGGGGDEGVEAVGAVERR